MCSCSSSGARRGYSRGINSAEGQTQNWGSGSAQSVAGTERAKHGKRDCWVIFSGRQIHTGGAGGCHTRPGWPLRAGGTGRRCCAAGSPAGAVHSLRSCSQCLAAGCSHATRRHSSSPRQTGGRPGRHHTQRLHFLPRPGSCSVYLHPLIKGSMLGGGRSIVSGAASGMCLSSAPCKCQLAAEHLSPAANGLSFFAHQQAQLTC